MEGDYNGIEEYKHCFPLDYCKKLIDTFVEEDLTRRYYLPSLGQELYLNALMLIQP